MSQTSLIPIENVDPGALFANQVAMTDLLARIRSAALAEVGDAATDKGRKSIKSLAHKIARSKTTIDDAGKNIVEGWKRQAKEIDALRKLARDDLDALKEQVLKPVTDWEEEQARIAQEQAEAARRAQEEAEAKKRAEEDERRREIERKEAELREREEAIRRHERIERERAEALARVRRDEEEAARRRERETAERERIEREAKERAEIEAKAAIERAERERQEAVRARIEAEERAKEDARLAATAAEERVRREADEAARKKAEEEERQRIENERRAANLRHRKSVNAKATAKFVEFGIDPEIAERVVIIIASGAIPAVTVTY